MRVVAATSDRYLISVSDDLAEIKNNPLARARVLRTRERKLGNPQNIHTFIGLPGWKECIMTREETDALLMQFNILTDLSS